MPTVLLVALDRNERSLLWAELDAAGYEVTGVPGLDEALVRLPDLRPDLVVFDTRGQPLDAATLRDLRQTTACPILALAGPYDLARSDLAAHPFDRILVRPLFVGDILAAVRELLPRAPRANPD